MNYDPKTDLINEARKLVKDRTLGRRTISIVEWLNGTIERALNS
jgi:hypothetical protein